MASYAVDYRNMRTAIHGLFVGNNFRRMLKFHDRLKAIFCDDGIQLPEGEMAFGRLLYEREMAFGKLCVDYPEVKDVEEVNFRRFTYNDKGIKGVYLDGKWCRIVNLIAVDI